MNFELLEIKKPLLKWYDKEHRDLKWRNTKNPYLVWVSEIMLQQTRVEAVKDYYDRFLVELPDIEHLAAVKEDRLLKLWEGLGYYNRVRNMQKAALQIMDLYEGVFPQDYEQVIKLSGIGEYTAGAICSICFEKPIPAVDGNVLRVMMRLLDCYDNIDNLKTKRMVKQWLLPVYESGDCGKLTQALMELGAVICIPNGEPKCKECPLMGLCKAYQKQTFSKLPIRKAKAKRKKEQKTVFVLHVGNRYGIRKRSAKGLLANMWEFYHTDTKMTKNEALDFISQQGFSPVLLEREIPYTHIFSHIEWEMTAYYISCDTCKEELIWIDKEEFESEYALPTAFKVFLKGVIE